MKSPCQAALSPLPLQGGSPGFGSASESRDSQLPFVIIVCLRYNKVYHFYLIQM